MFPSDTSINIRNRNVRDFESRSDRGLTFPALKCFAYLNDSLFIKDRLSHFAAFECYAQTCLYCMAFVLAIRNVLQIGQAWISLVAVFMIDLLSLWAGAKKSASNNAMNRETFLCAINEQCDMGIVSFLSAPSKQFVGYMLARFLDALNTAKIRDGIRVFVSWYNAPFFGLKFFSGETKIVVGHDEVAFHCGSAQACISTLGPFCLQSL